MTEIVRFHAPDGISVLVEADEKSSGIERAARGADGVVQAAKLLEDALATARGTVAAALRAMDGLGFEQLSMEFGVRLSAEAGAMIVKTTGEAHLKITASWGHASTPPEPTHAGTPPEPTNGEHAHPSSAT